MVNSNKLLRFKIVLLGEGGTGKSCLINRYIYNEFSLHSQMTIGVNFHSIALHEIVSGQTANIDLSVWDFGGQERFRPLLPKMLAGTNGAMLVFDLTSLISVKKLVEWNEMIQDKGENVPFIVVGTKKDIVDMDPPRRVAQDYLDEILAKLGNPSYFETSSKLGINTDIAFNSLVHQIIKKYEKTDKGIF